jgi:hypothetical protein
MQTRFLPASPRAPRAVIQWHCCSLSAYFQGVGLSMLLASFVGAMTSLAAPERDPRAESDSVAWSALGASAGAAIVVSVLGFLALRCANLFHLTWVRSVHWYSERDGPAFGTLAFSPYTRVSRTCAMMAATVAPSPRASSWDSPLVSAGLIFARLEANSECARPSLCPHSTPPTASTPLHRVRRPRRVPCVLRCTVCGSCCRPSSSR